MVMRRTSRYLIPKSTVSVPRNLTQDVLAGQKLGELRLKYVMFSQAKKWRLICTRFKQRLAPVTRGTAGVSEG